jgi:hypothetical protein
MNWWRSLIGVYYQPAKVFEGMKDRPRWLVPLAAAVAVTVLVTAIIMKPLVLPEQAERVASNPDLSNEQREAISERMNSPLVYWSGIIGALVSQPVLLLLVSLVFWGMFSMLGGKTKFPAMLSATAYGALISIPASLVKVPLMFAKQTAKVHTSLALLLSPDIEETFLFRLLAQFDFFMIWMLVVMAIGYSVYTGVKRSTAYYAVFGMGLAWALAVAALGGMFNFGMR